MPVSYANLRDWVDQNQTVEQFFAIGRLKSGISIDHARAEMTAIERRLEQRYPEGNSGIGISLIPTQEQTVKEIRPASAQATSIRSVFP